ncbi:hypothetical protein CTM97_19900 [Photobacterium phosphoreum]|uniref:DUF4868 domain-containing protein n=1 Tax=Photobacterium phosphoreum TaxID=659 RepID=A0A2T3JV83_PHOPO|nr:Kiwa anti-phage protein KwaB-like domain-containing protein [Photobacterium phosphoreum]PSU23019.1 hypothetical protein CTM96_15390 [Photobacterium phosphoreum]PSU37753.1 hypothetical protein CTM97_19900 [Photobacterium phosphoreum]PSU53175.1 hypothetical protein C9J18_05570 [Photobacterium phosphoreum]
MTGQHVEKKENIHVLHSVLEQIDLEAEHGKLKNFLECIKSLNDYSKISVKMYVIRFNARKNTSLINTLSRMETDRTLNKILINKVISAVEQKESIVPFLDLNIDNNESIFYERKALTDYSSIEEAIVNSKVVKFDEETLSSNNGYAIEIILPKGVKGNAEEIKITAFTYFAKAWKLKETSKFFLKDGGATTENKESNFCIFDYVTFICMDDGLFVLNNNVFQTIMNYTERLEKRKLETLDELNNLGFIHKDGIDIFVEAIGNDKSLLKNLAATQRSGHYRNPIFKSKLLAIVRDKKLGNLRFDNDNNIIVDNDKRYIKEIIILLGDKRVKTLILENVADVEGNLHLQTAMTLTAGSLVA